VINVNPPLALYPFQETGVTWLMGRTDALLADDMGLGKTAQAVVAALRLKLTNVLVICPASVRAVWLDELRRWGGEPVLKLWRVMSYDAFRNTSMGKGMIPPRSNFDLVIIDEAHYLKTPSAMRTKVIFGKDCEGGFVRQCRRVWLLTGTPTPNNASELWPMLRAVFPGLIHGSNGKPRNQHQFIQRYCRLVETGFGAKIVGAKRVPELKGILSQIMLRRRKLDVLTDLPSLRIALLPLEATAPAASSDFAAEVRKALASDGLAGLQGLGETLATYRRAVGVVKADAVARWVKDQLESGLGKVVLFAHHREVIEIMAVALKAYAPAVLTGSSSPKEREAAVDRFQRNRFCKVFVGQLQAAGTGITLNAASDVVLVEQSWVPGDNEQAIMRIHRIGQRSACIARIAHVPNSIDEDIARACSRKLADIDKLFN
jgi:SNF2 family DNA or RNA helicase